MDSLSDALKNRLARVGMDRAITAQLILDGANRVLPLAARAKTFHDGTLTLEFPNSAEAYLFKQDMDTYLEQVNAALSAPVVERFRLRISH